MKTVITEWCRQQGFPAAPTKIDGLVTQLERLQKANTPLSRAKTSVQSKIAVLGEQRKSMLKRIFTGPKNRR